MRKDFNLLPITIFAITMLLGCAKNPDLSTTNTTTTTKSIIAVGNSYKGDYTFTWGLLYPIVPNPYIHITNMLAVCISGNNEYISGYDDDYTDIYNQYSQFLSKNGVLQNMSSLVGADMSTLFVSGNDVYFSGTGYQIKKNGSYGEYFKNGKRVVLTDSTKTNANTSSISVLNNDVYVVGSENNILKYWKNGTAVNLTNGATSVSPRSIFVTGNDVYVTGSENGVFKYWKNGKSTSMPDMPDINSIIVDGTNIYLECLQTKSYWKNGVQIKLDSNNDYYKSANTPFPTSKMFLNGGDIYISGSLAITGYKAVPVYWKNGTLCCFVDEYGNLAHDGATVTFSEFRANSIWVK